MYLIAVNELARIARVSKRTMINRLHKNKIKTFVLDDRRLAVEAKEALTLIQGMIEYTENFWTLSELAESLGVGESFLRKAVRAGVLKMRCCQMREGFRFAQPEIQEFLYRLEFADPMWRTKRKDKIIEKLIKTYSKFPGVEAWEAIRK